MSWSRLPQAEGIIVSLAPIYEGAKRHGYSTQAEHVVIGGIPVQFLVSSGPLTDEAIERAATLRFGDMDIRVVRPEYLIAMLSTWFRAHASVARTGGGASR